MKTIFLATLALLAVAARGQDSAKQEVYAAYNNLVQGKWETKGKWAGGAEFHQVVDVEYELTKNIFTVRTYDYIDSKLFDNSQRNYGIRAWDKKEGKMKFWEFDVFGGIIQGEVFNKGRDIYHAYEYTSSNGSKMHLADIWIYVDANTYTFKVCEYKNGQPGKEFMASTYIRRK
jgi:hypothetical protein